MDCVREISYANREFNDVLSMMSVGLLVDIVDGDWSDVGLIDADVG